MNNPADKLRKLTALYNDKSTTDGERTACLAAINRLKASMPAEMFEAAQREAAGKTDAGEFTKKHGASARRKPNDFEKAQRQRDFVKHIVDLFDQRPPLSAQEIFREAMGKMAKGSTSKAYPNAYGDRGK